LAISITILIFKCSISSPADVVVLRWAYKHVREISRRMECYRGDLQAGHPSFAEGSQAVTQPVGAPTEISAPKIVYSKEDDDAIDKFHRRTGSYNVNCSFELALTFCRV
jgi:alcohol oxidase